MNTVLLTGWTGTAFAKIACWTLPLAERYAAIHGMAFSCSNLAGERPASWNKVALLHKALQNFEQAVWLDADVVVMDPSSNIADEVPADAWQGLVCHHTECGVVPNCGVWVCRRPMLPVLESMWNAGKYLTHCWWEQMALLELMGYAPSEHAKAEMLSPTELHARTAFLSQSWNHHPQDTQRVDSPRFRHVTMYADRHAECRRLAELASKSDAWASD